MTLLPRLYTIADAAFGDPAALAAKLFQGGAMLVQIRNKVAASGELVRQSEAIVRAAPPAAMVVVNDRADVALLARATGVHVGRDDLPAGCARLVVGTERLVGCSTHTEAQALEADGLPVDYIAFGPVFSTSGKQNPDPVVGLDRLRAVCEAVRKPVVAIGGITLDRAAEVLAAGAQSVAVISDILRSRDISERVDEFLRVTR